MAKIELDKVVQFEKLLHAFARIERIANVDGRKERENDVEHSYFLAMLAWYVADAFALPLNKNLLRTYALAHDFVEVYAGDTYIFDPDACKTKKEREEKARLRIKSEFPEFGELHDSIEKYEAQADAESRFIKALDKVEPVIANYLQKGRTWKEMNVTLEEARNNKRAKLAHHEEMRELMEEIFARIEPEKSDYFPCD